MSRLLADVSCAPVAKDDYEGAHWEEVKTGSRNFINGRETAMNIFICVSGLASIFALILQLVDAFPKHRQTRIKISILIIGVFIGLLLGVLTHTEIDITFPKNPILSIVGIILIILAAVLTIIIVGAFFIGEEYKARILVIYFLGACLLITTITTLFILSLPIQVDNSIDEYTLEEILSLAEVNKDNNNHDRALILLDKARKKLSQRDSRLKFIDKEMEEIKNRQMEQFSQFPKKKWPSVKQ